MGWSDLIACCSSDIWSPCISRLLRSFLQWLVDLNYSIGGISDTRNQISHFHVQAYFMPRKWDSIILILSWMWLLQFKTSSESLVLLNYVLAPLGSDSEFMFEGRARNMFEFKARLQQIITNSTHSCYRIPSSSGQRAPPMDYRSVTLWEISKDHSGTKSRIQRLLFQI